MTRPQSSHRLSIGSTPASNTPPRHSASRHHSHSVSLGAVNPSHRITRRKSMNASAVNSAAAVAAALQDDGTGISKRRSLNLKNSGGSRGFESTKHANSNHDRYDMREAFNNATKNVGDAANDESAVADDFLSPDNIVSMSKTKARRASEGAYLTKGEGKRASGGLTCEKCGKGYKHSSCLTKHLSVFSNPFVFQLLNLHLPPLSMHVPFQKALPCTRSSTWFWVFWLTLLMQVGTYS